MESTSKLPCRLDLELEKLKLTGEQGAKFYTNEELPLEYETAAKYRQIGNAYIQFRLNKSHSLRESLF